MTLRAPGKWGLMAVLAFGVPILAIALVQYRWLLEIRSRSEVIATQQNHEAALRALDILENEMSAARLQVLPPVGHADLLTHELEPIAQVFRKGHERFSYVDRFFVWARPMPVRDALFYDPANDSFTADPARVALMPDSVWTWRPEDGKGRWEEYACLGETPSCHVVLHLILDDDEQELLAVAGFTVDLERFAREFVPAFARESLTPAVREFLGSEETAVSFFDGKGDSLHGVDSQSSFAASSVELPVSFTLPSEGAQMMATPRWRLSVGEPSADRIQALLRRGAIGNLAVVTLGILALAVGGALVARSSAREATLSDLKSRFISGISHELKTPLAMIRLYSEMLELGRVPLGMERKLFYSLRQQAEIMHDMLEEILDFSRLEAEQGSLRMDMCSLKEIVEEAVEMRDFQSGADRSVDVRLSPDLPPVRCNRSALVRVVYSLLDNATKYSGPHEPIVVAAAKRNGMVSIEVADRGLGIAPEDMPHVFERFYRGRSSTGIKGTGLGLSIVQSVVKGHGGRVEVASEPGKGTRFTVLLPTRFAARTATPELRLHESEGGAS